MITRTKKNKGISVPVTNSAKILSWMVETHQITCLKEKRPSLMSDLRQKLFDIFGKQDTTITFEFRNKLWTLKHNDLTFNVYSAAGKGTSIEICNFTYDEINSGLKDIEIIEFLTELDNLLK